MPDHQPAAAHFFKVTPTPLEFLIGQVHHRILCQGKGAAHPVIIVGSCFLDEDRVDVNDFHPEIVRTLDITHQLRGSDDGAVPFPDGKRIPVVVDLARAGETQDMRQVQRHLAFAASLQRVPYDYFPGHMVKSDLKPCHPKLMFFRHFDTIIRKNQ